jgi:short-subunit dehydrogenase
MSRMAMVTGASSGIGEAFAERLADEGWDLVLVARRRDRLEEVAARVTGAHGVSARVVVADLADQDQLEAVCAEAAALPLDMLVNNAALAHYMPFTTLPAGEARELVQLNVLAPVLLTHAVIAGMVERGQGAVINVASLLAFSGSWDAHYLPKRAVYAASKSFLVSFTQILAGELRESGVRAQVVCPGVVRSEFHTRQGMDMSDVPRMEPHSVVQASLLDLERGIVVSIPGSEHEAALRAIDDAAGALLPATRTVELPDRYHEADGEPT